MLQIIELAPKSDDISAINQCAFQYEVSSAWLANYRDHLLSPRFNIVHIGS